MASSPVQPTVRSQHTRLHPQGDGNRRRAPVKVAINVAPIRAVVVGAWLFAPANACHAQQPVPPYTDVASAMEAPPPAGVSSSRIVEASPEAPPASVDTLATRGNAVDRHTLLQSVGIEPHVGLNGAGVDVALPIARRWNFRIGGQYIRYHGNFTSDGAQIDAAMRLGNGKAGVDWFPFGNGFRVSPQFYFAIQTDVQGRVIVPAGQSVTLNGSDYVSSATDPLTGTAHVSTRKWAPGLSVGWGNISPRGRSHWSFPVEFGFYYIGQPTLNVTFQGSACDPSQPPATGCQSVTSDASFQRDLSRFIARNNNNLKYAAFFPVLQTGVGFRF